MKKWWKRAGMLFTLLIIIYLGVKPDMLVGKPGIKAESAVLMDMNSEQILMNYNGSEEIAPAGVSKLMTELLIMESVANGDIRWDDPVNVSLYASSVGGNQLALKQGDRFTVQELFQVVAVYSANDAAVALAEHISGSEHQFVERMNQKAVEIGLSGDTHFTNSTGLSEAMLGPNRPHDVQGQTLMTAIDACKLAKYLLNHHPEILKVSSQMQVSMHQKGIYMSNTNWMLSSIGGVYAYDGNDGLKTGYDKDSGYHFVGTAERNGKRLISVVFGTDTREARFVETRKLLNYGFSSTKVN
ncbi:D-alanyl-D-alanine carboxypeptidase family protein [Paenibacillus silvae]|uniref:D-alanyl-D-alanine carboxypeptidase family protein n=1 Tax=Paenibacillus silvae TaxID=1325358 RepID=UPI0011A88340|nr:MULTISPECIES: D-alanyl-D-alanine carboxypeptidase family protein [Paenibacillus]MCK6076622.1 D-alanyl-D-alanine carboxypeptidase [Paenibacillus silvae]MCK6151049.1 D-alanyl-D-alanine carboxypeptidase [Paenibacillus silvae]MCK6269308.1 D-alanyl-D-alanine carboxypeptidase [Paenibacillus silvae]